MNKKEVTCINCETHHKKAEYLDNLIYRILKSIPKTTLIDYLVKAKIIKRNYITNKITLNEKTDKNTLEIKKLNKKAIDEAKE